MKKLRIVFPFVEAGFGHMMTERSICDAFEKKYGEYFEIVRSNFFKEQRDETLIKFEQSMGREVRRYNKSPLYAHLTIFLMDLFGTKIVSRFVMKASTKGAYEASMKHMEELEPDIVISTHWSTNYYAMKMENRPYTVMHVPDAHINTMFRYPCDLTTISMPEGYLRAMKLHKRHFKNNNLKRVPLAIRKEAFEITETREELRERWGLDDRFTIYLTEGGYGIGMAEKLCQKIIEEDLPINVIIVCGKNPELYQRIRSLESKGNTKIYPFGFTNKVLELIAMSDLYLGKSGNGLMEPAFFGVPIVVTHSANVIERRLAEHYVTYWGDAMRIFKLKKCLKFIKEAMNGSEKYLKLKENRVPRDAFGGEGIADVIFAELDKKFNIIENFNKEKEENKENQ